MWNSLIEKIGRQLKKCKIWVLSKCLNNSSNQLVLPQIKHLKELEFPHQLKITKILKEKNRISLIIFQVVLFQAYKVVKILHTCKLRRSPKQIGLFWVNSTHVYAPATSYLFKSFLSLNIFLCFLCCYFISDVQKPFAALQFAHPMRQKLLNLVKEWGKYGKHSVIGTCLMMVSFTPQASRSRSHS